MEFRKIRREEHGKTRALWEQIFIEDSADFLDYYYKIKTADNEIYTAEEDGLFRSMLQLNPYRMHLSGCEVMTHYVIAVATEKEYRHRGLMAALLKKSMRQMYENREPFVFLMPAAEAIYRPFDFRYIYGQTGTVIASKNLEGIPEDRPDCTWEDAGEEDAALLAEFAEEFLCTKYSVYTVRDAHYYEVMRHEQDSENGGIRILRHKGEAAGCFFYEIGEECSVREPLILPGFEHEFIREVLHLSGERDVKCTAYGQENKKPLIMARILHLETMIGCLEVSDHLDLRISVDDPILKENCGCFHLHAERGKKIKVLRCKDTAEDRTRVPVSVLTEILFGYTGPDILEGAVTEEQRAELGKIIPASPVFLNEIV